MTTPATALDTLIDDYESRRQEAGATEPGMLSTMARAEATSLVQANIEACDRILSLAAERDELVATLKSLEWYDDETMINRQCRRCGGDEKRGHDADCPIGKLLARYA